MESKIFTKSFACGLRLHVTSVSLCHSLSCSRCIGSGRTRASLYFHLILVIIWLSTTKTDFLTCAQQVVSTWPKHTYLFYPQSHPPSIRHMSVCPSISGRSVSRWVHWLVSCLSDSQSASLSSVSWLVSWLVVSQFVKCQSVSVSWLVICSVGQSAVGACCDN